MSDAALRSGLVRLAYENPNLRGELLPLLNKQAGGKAVAWAVPRGAKTLKGVLLTVVVRSEALYTKGQTPTPEGVAARVVAVGEEQGVRVRQFVEAIVKASQKAQDVWGFTFTSHGPNQTPNPVRVDFNEHGLYLAGTYEFHLLQTAKESGWGEHAENVAKFNKTLMELEAVFF